MHRVYKKNLNLKPQLRERKGTDCLYSLPNQFRKQNGFRTLRLFWVVFLKILPRYANNNLENSELMYSCIK